MCKGLAALPASYLERVKEFKARFGSFLQRQDWSLPFLPYKEGKPRPTLEECLQWKESFEKLLSSKHGLYAFRAFLISEFSEENIAFYLACEDFKKTRSAAKLPSKAERIFNEFIGTEAPREVNIDHETQDITKANLLHPTTSCFEKAQHLIYILMEKDCYPRYLRSAGYRDLISQLTFGKQHPMCQKKA
ncbi:regulator of G-protein signaling 16 [Clupea harengus]|uniref:Regulator of G-protein signaling 16 n=1 Tax=Clupea harengus TaxID=7950 RepID=A0A6P3W4S6_CLUHA|nr:regulator of G-protein signaling 16 [Clupea harengus]